MARTRRRSVRLWQTELFIVVIVVAILVLSVSLSQGLQRTLKQLGESDQVSDASALASQIGREFPLTVESRARIRDEVREFRLIYNDDVWVFDIDGTVIDTAAEAGPPADVLEQARVQGLADAPPFSTMSLTPDGYVVAGKAVYDADGRRAAVVVVSSAVDDSLAVLEAVRGRLWTTFWVALVVAGSLGFGFAEFIGRRVRRMTQAAAAIADGDFEQRLPTGLVPDEIYELAESYNQMTVTLGETFSTLREREREIATVVESMGEGVIAFDAEGAVRVMNPQAEVFLGLRADGAAPLGSHISELTSQETLVRLVDRGLAGANVSGTMSIGEWTLLLHCTPIASTDQHPEGAVLIMSDITERQRLEDAQRRFVANASHEMRTPIAALKGLLELLTGGAAERPETRDDFLHTMTLEVDRLGRLVADLLTLAQLEAGSLTLRLEPVSVRELLAGVATVLRPLADGSGISLIVDAEDGLEAYCDRDRVTQVLVGFVDNALKHSGSADAVYLRARMLDDVIAFEVADGGPGIDPDLVPRLFDRFFRVDGSGASPRGAGLGLAIAKEIVEAHGSVVEVESRPDQGTTFRFKLPAAR